MKIYMFILLIFSLFLTGCAKEPSNCNGVLSITPYLREHNKPYSDEYVNIANEIYLYALMSANAYGSNDFKLPDSISLIESFDKGKGLQGNIYQKDNNVIIIAFRGTEGLQDWWYGNIWKSQYDLSDKIVEDIVLKYPGNKIIATGHSLGGGLALHASLSSPHKVEAVVFNPSYRVHSDDKQEDNRRIVIAEKGEILKMQRWAWKNPHTTERYEQFYCTKTNNHSMYLLARCAMHVAAISSDQAFEILQLNPHPSCETK